MDGCEINVNKLIRNLFVLQGNFVNLYNTADSNFLVNNYLFGQVKHQHPKRHASYGDYKFIVYLTQSCLDKLCIWIITTVKVISEH